MARSRQNTPSAPAGTASIHRTRATRSRTHDQDAPVPASETRSAASGAAARRSNRAKSVESNASIASRGLRAQRRVVKPQEAAQVDLTTVEENSDEEVDLEIPPPDEPDEDAIPSRELDIAEDDDPHQHSMSGTTVRSEARSDDGDDTMYPHALLANASVVYQASLDLFRSLSDKEMKLEDLLKFMDVPRSAVYRTFSTAADKLYEAIASLGDAFGMGEALVAPDQIVAQLFGHLTPSADSPAWLTIEFAELLNLAVFTRRFASQSQPGVDEAERLSQVDAQFPAPFLQNLYMPEGDEPAQVGYSRLYQETFDIALSIRLQATALSVLRELGEGDLKYYERMVDNVFLASAASKGRQQTLRAWDANGIGSGKLGLDPEFERKIRKEVRRFKQRIREDLEELDDGEEARYIAKHYSWGEFRLAILSWTYKRMEEIRASINDAGGIEALVESIRMELQNHSSFDVNDDYSQMRSPAKRRPDVTIQEDVEDFPPNNDDYSGLGPPSTSTAATAQRGKTVASASSAVRANSRVERAPSEDSQFQAWELDEIQRKKIAKQQATPASNNSRQRAFVDEQRDAQRIENFEDTQHSQSQRPATSRAQKRPRTVDPTGDENGRDEDVSDDDGFEQDGRAVNMSQNRKAVPRLAASPKRVRVEDPVVQEDANFLPTQDVNVLRNETAAPTSTYAEAREIMSTQSQRIPIRRPVQQVRKTWSRAAEEQLENLVKEHGCSWALLKSIDSEGPNLFEGRGQVDLKDKARNMKVSMLLSGTALPPNWFHVPIGAKESDRLEKAGFSKEELIKLGCKVRNPPPE